LYFPFPTEEITEGSITLTIPKLKLFSKGPSEYIPSKAPVFYNPRMELNRDIAVLALKVYQKKINQHIQICDPLTGCGVRGLRFTREVDGVDFAVLNDISLNAARLAWVNAKKNGLDAKVFVERMDARALLGNCASYGGFNVIDLDPYGSPSLFLGFALAALKNRGLLALTATDMGPLCGINSKACIRKYLAKSLRTEYCHELALRILINSVARSAAQYNRGVNILFSHSTDHYIRAYVQVRHGAKRADEGIKDLGYILHCFRCLNRKWIFGLVASLDTKCEVCGDKLAIAGPLWLGKLADLDFCREIYEETEKTFPLEKKQLLKLISLVMGEINLPPTYFVVDKVCKNLGLSSAPRDIIIRKLVKMGYEASRTHFNSQGIKSNASILTIKENVKEVFT
jgi:tRNA (guanine26-N2/guanine27-N2)-dimethyltransferase